jgi:hypothetical protein
MFHWFFRANVAIVEPITEASASGDHLSLPLPLDFQLASRRRRAGVRRFRRGYAASPPSARVGFY